ncbi:MAG: DUF4340 domain-containing protein [Oscillospiraceae bacterium]|nr:DUF4340 domain-containing protein [Oscillospiraceae bacterium]
MKQFKPVIITAVVLVILAAAALITVKLLPEKETPPIEIPGLEMSETIEILDIDLADVKSVDFLGGSLSPFSLDMTNKTTASVRGEDGLLPFDETKMFSVINYLSTLAAREEIGTDDGNFGFENPSREVRFTLKNGEVQTLLVGDALPVGEGVYVKRSDGDTVWSVGGMSRDFLFTVKENLRNIELFPEIPEETPLSSVTLSRPGKKTVSLVRKTDKEIAENKVISTDYKIESPVKAETNPDTVKTLLLDKVRDIRAKSLVEDRPRDLAKYGLASPSRLSFKTNKLSVTLLIGNDADGGEGTYVMVEGIPSVLLTEKTIDFKNISLSDIIFPLIWFYTAEEVSEIVYNLPDAHHTLSLSVSDNTLTGKYDGGEISGENAKNLFLHSVRFTAAGEFMGEKYETTPALTLTARLKGGKTSTLSLHRMNERQYAASIDGKTPDFYVGVSEMENLISCFEILKNGGDVPSLF